MLKQYVQNKARSEGFIIEAYVINKSSTFYSRVGMKLDFLRMNEMMIVFLVDKMVGQFQLFM